MQGDPSGRLLSYNPATKKTHVVAQGFWFANGVALSKDETFIAVVETNTQTVHRVWLAGAKASLPVFSSSLYQKRPDPMDACEVWLPLLKGEMLLSFLV